jgi:hypothetical protein
LNFAETLRQQKAKLMSPFDDRKVGDADLHSPYVFMILMPSLIEFHRHSGDRSRDDGGIADRTENARIASCNATRDTSEERVELGGQS